MVEKMNVDVSVEDWNGYGGLRNALEDAIEKMKSSSLIRKITKLMTEIEEAHEDYQKRHRVVQDIKSDINQLQHKVDRL